MSCASRVIPILSNVLNSVSWYCLLLQVNINGTVDGGFQGDIAMDDIEVSCCLESKLHTLCISMMCCLFLIVF